MLTKAELHALLITIANNKFNTLVAWYQAVDSGDLATAVLREADVRKWDELTKIVNYGINQLDVIANLNAQTP